MNKIPTQKMGKSFDYSKELIFDDETQAFARYRIIVQKLLNVNEWDAIADGISAKFAIVNPKNEHENRRVRKNDYIRIDIPGPGTPSSHGYDWVKVTELDQYEHHHKRKTFISLQPSPDPSSLEDHTAHFFKKYASSNLMVRQEENKVIINYAGRNEVKNTDTDHILDNVRNFLVGITAQLGASYPQWKALVDGLAK